MVVFKSEGNKVCWKKEDECRRGIRDRVWIRNERFAFRNCIIGNIVAYRKEVNGYAIYLDLREFLIIIKKNLRMLKAIG